MADEPQEPPVGDEPQEPPVGDETQEPPVGDELQEPPVGDDDSQEPPAADEPQEPPVADEPQEPPVADEPQEPPGGDEPQEPPVADGGVPKVPLKHWLMNDHCTKVSTERWRTPVYQLHLREVPMPNSAFHVYEYGERKTEDDRSKVIMIVGATGAGKTTLINSLINYVFGVEMTDDFRFQLVAHDPTRSQSQSQTECVSSYTLHHQEGFRIPYTLTIIDTPGFGDTAGITRDDKTIRQICEFFNADPPNLGHIDAVGFVVGSTQSRLGDSQKYIFGSIMSLFGRDISENILVMFTFCDLKDPQILPSIQEAKIPYQEYFKFNNSAIFLDAEPEAEDMESGDEENPFTDIFWKLGMKSFKKFTVALEKLKPRNPAMTKEVLQRRREIEDNTGNLYRLLESSISKQKEMDQLDLERRIGDTQQASADSSNGHRQMDGNEKEDDGQSWRKTCCCCASSKKEITDESHLVSNAEEIIQEEPRPVSSQEITGDAIEDIRQHMIQELKKIKENIISLPSIALKTETRSVIDIVEAMIIKIQYGSDPDKQVKVQELRMIQSRMERL